MDLSFSGRVRITLTGLMNQLPVISAAQASRRFMRRCSPCHPSALRHTTPSNTICCLYHWSTKPSLVIHTEVQWSTLGESLCCPLTSHVSSKRRSLKLEAVLLLNLYKTMRAQVSLVEIPDFSFAVTLYEYVNLMILPGLESFIHYFIRDIILRPLVLPESVNIALVVRNSARHSSSLPQLSSC